jgi:hypothetical protein
MTAGNLTGTLVLQTSALKMKNKIATAGTTRIYYCDKGGMNQNHAKGQVEESFHQ